MSTGAGEAVFEKRSALAGPVVNNPSGLFKSLETTLDFGRPQILRTSNSPKRCAAGVGYICGRSPTNAVRLRGNEALTRVWSQIPERASVRKRGYSARNGISVAHDEGRAGNNLLQFVKRAGGNNQLRAVGGEELGCSLADAGTCAWYSVGTCGSEHADGCTSSAGDPFAFIFSNQEIVYRGTDGAVHLLFLQYSSRFQFRLRPRHTP